MKKISKKKISKKKLNYLLKNGGNCSDIIKASDSSINDNLDTKIFFVIIKTKNGKIIEHLFAQKEDDTYNDNSTIISGLDTSRENVNIYCTDWKAFKEIYINIIVNNNVLRLKNNIELTEILSTFTLTKGYVSDKSINFIDKYYLLIRVKDPSFADEFPDGVFPDYYHILESSETLPIKYHDTFEETESTFQERFNIMKRTYDTPLENRYDTLKDKYDTLQMTHKVLTDKYKTLQRNFDDLQPPITHYL